MEKAVLTPRGLERNNLDWPAPPTPKRPTDRGLEFRPVRSVRVYHEGSSTNLVSVDVSDALGPKQPIHRCFEIECDVQGAIVFDCQVNPKPVTVLEGLQPPIGAARRGRR